ncbi:MAG: hypothetical protein ACRDQ7_21635 [Haloechinothrix sp.]
MSNQPWVTALHSAGVCEVIWVPADGRPDAVAATPLVWNDRPTLAFPYAQAQVGRSISAARQVAVVLSDARLTGSGWHPIAVVGRPELIEDRAGSVFTAELLDQELRKHPPSRVLADSILLRREHWWFLPRILITIEPEAVISVAARKGGTADAVLGVSEVDPAGDRLRVATVQLEGDERNRPTVLPLGTGALPAGDEPPRPAVLLRHDFSEPDLERWSSWTASGTLTGDVFDTEGQRGSVVLPPPPGLLARMRRQRDLARSCRRELT